MDARADQSAGASLQVLLARDAGSSGRGAEVAAVILKISEAATELSRLIRLGALGGAFGTATGSANADGDTQKSLDVAANALILDALKATPTAYYASEEEDAILTLRPGAALAVAVDPLDGSSNIDANISIGTIFSIYPASADGATASFFRPGREQLAAGYFVYGPHTALVLTTGSGTDILVLDDAAGLFRLITPAVQIPSTTNEFAINASNYRHWFEPIRVFIDDCLDGKEGPRGKDFNMRWVASLVAETHRIFARGGVFLYPADRRNGYEHGRLRLIYEAAPIAMLAEQAGGAATDGHHAILDKIPTQLHERTPLVFGSAQKIAVIARYHANPDFQKDRAPLFGRRGLFQS